MAMSPQQKILHVANQLGISDMKNMQASTGVLYHNQNIATGPGANQPNMTYFGSALQGAVWIDDTNVNTDGKLEVNEAMLVEKIQFNYVSTSTNPDASGKTWSTTSSRNLGAIVDFYIGNKRVVKSINSNGFNPFLNGAAVQDYFQCEFYLEGAGILIPPQVEFYVNAYFYDNDQLTPWTGKTGFDMACTLYGTRVLLNLNTTL